MNRSLGVTVLLAGTLLATIGAWRFADRAAEARWRGPLAAGLTGSMSGPDSAPRSSLHQDIVSCIERHRASLGRTSFSESEARLGECVAIAERYLASSPADGFGWVQLASLRLEADGPGEGAASALRLAYEAGPYDGSAVVQRLSVAVALHDRLTQEDWALVRRDLARAVYYGANLSLLVASIGSHPSRRQALERLTTDFDAWHRQRFDEAMARASGAR